MSSPQQIWDAKVFPNAQRPSLYEHDTKKGKWEWKEPSKDRLDNGDLIFANVDATYRIVSIDEIPEHCLTKKHRVYKNVIKEVPVIDIYGVTEHEHSVTSHVWGAEPYFYVSCSVPEEDTEESLCRRVKHRLQCLMMGIDPESTNPQQREKACAYVSVYRDLIPGEIDLDEMEEPEELYIPDGILTKDFKLYVMDISIVEARSIYGAHENDRKFFKVTMASPRMISIARKYFQDPKYQKFRQKRYGCATQTFESNVAFVTRQMCDRKIRGMHWVKAKWTQDTRIAIHETNGNIKPYPYPLNPDYRRKMQNFLHQNDNGGYRDVPYDRLRDDFGLHKSESTSQIEIDVTIEDIIGIPEDLEYKNKLPPLRIWSLDIEVANSVRGMFPSATNPGDKVITVGGVGYHIGKAKKPMEIVAFVLGGVEGDIEIDENWAVEKENFHVYSYRSEEELFEGLQRYICDLDPDIISGFNIFGFDMKFLHNRAKYLKLSPEQWGYYGRCTKKPVSMKKYTFQSNAYGRKDFDICMVTGRCYLDVLETIQRDYTCKFRGFTLKNCSQIILQETKKDVDFWKITPMYIANGEERKNMVIYCIQDAYLPPQMEEKKGHAVLYVEQARLYGVNMTELILRGQQHRLLTYLINFCLDLEREGSPKLLVPKNDRISSGTRNKRDVQFEGATVVEPQSGFYENPVATIDFASLYPSIMLAHNLCYSTFIPPYKRRYYSEYQYFVTPSGDAFLYPHVKEGVLPKMLKTLLGARKDAKKKMACAKDPVEKAMYDAKQLALKLGANSVYGFTGAGIGSLPCFAVSRSVTAYGRDYIHMTKAFVEQLPMISDIKKYPLPKGLPKKKVNSGNGLSGDTPYPWLTTDEKGRKVYTEEYKNLIKEYLDVSVDAPSEYIAPYNCIYGDTDSVMILMSYLGYNDMDESVRVGKIIEKFCNAILYPEPVKMEWEKNYMPYLLLKKKKYIGLLWMDMKVRDKNTGRTYDRAIPLYIDAKGVMSVRRDNAPIESNLVKVVSKVLMGLTCEDKIQLTDLETVPPPWKPDEKPKPVFVKNPMKPDVKLAENIIKETLSSMSSGEVELEQYTITKSLSRREEDYSSLVAQVKVNRDIRARKPGTEYPLGARIPYIIGKTGERTNTQNAQDPLWMAENGIEVDVKYYRDRLSKPLVQIMAPVMYPSEFKNAVKRSKAVEEFFSNDYMHDGDDDQDMRNTSDDRYHMTDVYMEDDDDEDMANIYSQLNSNNIGAREEALDTTSDKPKKRVVTTEDFMKFNRDNSTSERRIVQKTYARLFLNAERTRKRKANVASRAKFEIQRKRKKGRQSAKVNVLDILVVPEEQNRVFQDEIEEKDAFRHYQNYREVINTLEKVNFKTHEVKIEENSDAEKDAFMRGTEIFKEIANPKEGCARMIQYDWGSRLEKYNKKKSFKRMAPLQYKKACKAYLSAQGSRPAIIANDPSKRKYKKSRDRFPLIQEKVKVSDISIKKKRLRMHVSS